MTNWIITAVVHVALTNAIIQTTNADVAICTELGRARDLIYFRGNPSPVVDSALLQAKQRKVRVFGLYSGPSPRVDSAMAMVTTAQVDLAHEFKGFELSIDDQTALIFDREKVIILRGKHEADMIAEVWRRHSNDAMPFVNYDNRRRSHPSIDPPLPCN